MKRYVNIISFLFIVCATAMMLSCKDDANHGGEGYVMMKMNIAQPHIDAEQAPATDNSDALADSCRVRIYNNKGLVRFYKGLDNVPASVKLLCGDYRIVAQTGDSLPATFKGGYYKGETRVTVDAATPVTADLVCKVTNTLVTVKITDELKAILADYEVKVESNTGALTFAGASLDSIGYFILSQGDNALRWTITGVKTDGTTYSQSGALNNIKAAMSYELTFDFTESEYTQGGLYFNILVDESAIEKVEHIVIFRRPNIEGDGFDMELPKVFEKGSGSDMAVLVSASSAFAQVRLACEQFTAMGMPGNNIDVENATADVLNAWQATGLTYQSEYNEVNDAATGRITLAGSVIAALGDGNYNIDISVADMHGKVWTKRLTIMVSDAVVITEDVIRHEIWAKRATLRASLLRTTPDALTFEYRAQGSDTWNSVEATLNGSDITAQVSGLASGTTYEYRIVSGDVPSAVVKTFTTESEFVIPNAGFEDWHQSGKVWLIYGSGESMWWDSGNHGSATLNINITTRDTGMKHSGNSSIKMQSQFVSLLGIGKFAAGNVFSGVYSGTDGTDGILDFGRPMNTRPSKLTGYYRYETGEVDYSNTDALPKGSPYDVGNIYIAVGDWDKQVHITTKDKNVFDRNDPNIIGFGEIVQTAPTQGDGLIPFTIDIDYRSMERIPTYIIIVGSASYYGDYFTGSSKSTLWLDDLELVYE